MAASASRLSSCVAVAAAVASASVASNRAYADSLFRFPSFPSPSAPPQVDPSSPSTSSDDKSQSKADEPRGSGFDPESLERGAKALREINSSPYAKQVLCGVDF